MNKVTAIASAILITATLGCRKMASNAPNKLRQLAKLESSIVPDNVRFINQDQLKEDTFIAEMTDSLSYLKEFYRSERLKGDTALTIGNTSVFNLNKKQTLAFVKNFFGFEPDTTNITNMQLKVLNPGSMTRQVVDLKFEEPTKTFLVEPFFSAHNNEPIMEKKVTRLVKQGVKNPLISTFTSLIKKSTNGASINYDLVEYAPKFNSSIGTSFVSKYDGEFGCSTTGHTLDWYDTPSYSVFQKSDLDSTFQNISELKSYTAPLLSRFEVKTFD